MEHTASTKLAIRPVDCSASSSSVSSFIRKPIHRTASPKAFFGKSSRSETRALISNPAPTSVGAIFQASVTPTSSQPGCEHVLRIALLDRMILLASRRVLQNLAYECNQPIPVFMLKGVVQPMGDWIV